MKTIMVEHCRGVILFQKNKSISKTKVTWKFRLFSPLINDYLWWWWWWLLSSHYCYISVSKFLDERLNVPHVTLLMIFRSNVCMWPVGLLLYPLNHGHLQWMWYHSHMQWAHTTRGDFSSLSHCVIGVRQHDLIFPINGIIRNNDVICVHWLFPQTPRRGQGILISGLGNIRAQAGS